MSNAFGHYRTSSMTITFLMSQFYILDSLLSS